MDARKHLKKILPKFITHRNYINKGSAEVNTFRYVVQVILLLKVAFIKLPIWVMILLGILNIVGFWAIGFAWDKMKGYHYEAEWGNKRNPTLQHIKEKLK